MHSSKDERQARADFAERYSLGPTDVLLEVESAVLGGDWGANGYTTFAQADLIAESLELSPSKRLLDIGTGQGWPGLYLAKTTGCEVVVTDLPIEGLHVAIRRAQAEGVRSLGAVVSSARHLPFAGEAFDAICHTDVLCWLKPKLSVLRACRRLLRPGGRLAYLTIVVAPGLTQADSRAAIRLGPRAVAARAPDDKLMQRAGFEDVRVSDVTASFLTAARSWHTEFSRHEDDLKQVLGEEEWEERQSNRRGLRLGIEEGWLQRLLVGGRAP